MKKRIWLTVVLLMAGISALPYARADATHEEAFFTANQAYQEGHYAEAINGYLGVIQSGHAGGSVYYNLGNAYFKSHQLGRAIRAYERALLFAPRDPDLNFNLSHARDQTRDAIGESRGTLKTIFFWVSSFSFNELFGCFAVLNFMFWAILILRLFKRSEWLYYLFLIIISLWMLSGISFGLKYCWVSSDERAIVLEKEVTVLAGPDTADTTLFKLHEGTVVHLERSEDGWSLIHLSDNKRGWVPETAVGRISLNSNGPVRGEKGFPRPLSDT